MIVCLTSAFYHVYQCVTSIKHNEPSLLPFSGLKGHLLWPIKGFLICDPILYSEFIIFQSRQSNLMAFKFYQGKINKHKRLVTNNAYDCLNSLDGQ